MRPRGALSGAKAPLALPALLAILGALALAAGCSRSASDKERQAWAADLQGLQAEQDSLRRVAQAIVERDARIQALPKGDVVIAVPTSFLQSVIEHIFTDVASRITLRLSGIKAHVAKKVKKVVTIGEFVVDVEINEVTGRLAPGQPALTFGGGRVAMALPIEIVDGHGDATIHFVWNGKNVADVACGDMDVTRRVSGNVVPAAYVVSGALFFEIQKDHVVGRPVFPETRVRIRVTPSKESWDTVHALLEEKKGVCGWVLDKVDVPKLLQGVVEEKGFNVKLPVDKLKPFRVPVAVRESVQVADRTLALEVRSGTLRIDPDAIWYGAAVRVR